LATLEGGELTRVRWNHFPNSELGKMHDDLLRAELGLPEVSYVFQYISH
jgi:DNA repair and recombination RAD54-like protein